MVRAKADSTSTVSAGSPAPLLAYFTVVFVRLTKALKASGTQKTLPRTKMRLMETIKGPEETIEFKYTGSAWP